MVAIIVGLIVLILILGVAVFNLLRKLEKAEDIVVSYMEYLDKLSRVIEISDKKLKEVDYKGSFKSDDEVGFVFEQIKSIQTILNAFIIKNLK